MSRRRHSRRGGGAAGFTLMEVMVAVAILGSAVFLLLEAHYGAVRLFNKSEEQVMLRELVSRAAGVAQLEVVMGQTAGNGDFGERYTDYTYEYTVENYSEDDDALKLVRLAISGPVTDYTTSFLMYVPAAQTDNTSAQSTAGG